MQIDDLRRVYQIKSDEELIRLAVAPEQLTADARLALRDELSRRSIIVADDAQLSLEGRDDASGLRIKKLQAGDYQHEGVGDLVAQVLRLYHRHFWLFFKITAPAVVISTFAVITGRREGHEIARQVLQSANPVAYRTGMLEIWLANLSAWFVTWMASCFVYGAICIAVEEISSEFSPSAWRSVLNVLGRVWPFLRLCLVLLVLLWGIGIVAALLNAGLLWALRQWAVHPTGVVIWILSFSIVGVGGIVFSRFMLAVPAVLLDDCEVGQAIFRSDQITQGKWLTLSALVSKSLIGGYVAAECPYWVAPFIRAAVSVPSWFEWILTVASMIGVTLVEPMMFVGFALLYLKASPVSAPSRALASQFT